MRHIQGCSRYQSALLPMAADDYIGPAHPVRVLHAFVERLDLGALGFRHVETAATGRPPYHPGMLLRLFLWGYLNRVRSSRRLEKECGRNVELFWLLDSLAPDFKTIANFRRDNAEALVLAGREFAVFCRGAGLFGAELVAVDGSKFQQQQRWRWPRQQQQRCQRRRQSGGLQCAGGGGFKAQVNRQLRCDHGGE